MDSLDALTVAVAVAAAVVAAAAGWALGARTATRHRSGSPPSRRWRTGVTAFVVLGAIAVTIGLLSDGLWAVVASRLREWFASSPRHGRRLSLVGGTSIIGLGIALAATGRPD